MTLRAHTLAAILCTPIACGGSAAVDPEGAGGAGGTTSPSSTSVVTTTTGPDPGVCADACLALGDCAHDVSDCDEACESQSAPCRNAHQAWLGCALGEASSMCGTVPGTVCGPELETYVACMGGFDDLFCEANWAGNCHCSAIAGPGAVVFEMACDPGKGCVCIEDGVEVGFCEEADAVCGIDDGCCAGVFFTKGL